MKSVTKKIDDIFYWAADFYKKYKAPLDAAKKAYDYSEELARNYERVRNDVFKSDNENINRLRAIGSSWRQMVGILATRDESYFLEISGMVLDPRMSMQSVVVVLEGHRADLIRIRQLSEVCITLVYTLSVSDHMDVKGLFESFVTTKALDLKGRQLAIKNFEQTIHAVGRILPVLDNAITYAQRWQAASSRQSQSQSDRPQ